MPVLARTPNPRQEQVKHHLSAIVERLPNPRLEQPRHQCAGSVVTKARSGANFDHS